MIASHPRAAYAFSMATTKSPPDAPGAAPPPPRDPRFQLIWDVALFQLKLAADSLRDLALMPVSLGVGIWGLLAGGTEPDRYFRRLQRFGRRSDVWINLFGEHRRGPTSDSLVKPLEESVYREYQRGWPRRRGEKAPMTDVPPERD